MHSKSCSFETERLWIGDWHSSDAIGNDPTALPQVVSALLTPTVTRALPEDWQGPFTSSRASNWIEERDREGSTLLVVERSGHSPAGLLILAEDGDDTTRRCVRLGYLIAESAWGRGLATELVEGFVQWCRDNDVALIIAGVEHDNLASQRVLEKCGFVPSADGDSTSELFYEFRF